MTTAIAAPIEPPYDDIFETIDSFTPNQLMLFIALLKDNYHIWPSAWHQENLWRAIWDLAEPVD